MAELKGHHVIFTSMLLNKEKHFGKHYLEAGNERLRVWYNNLTGKDVCISTINKYQKRLKDNKFIKKVGRRIKNLNGTWKIETSMTSILKPGMNALKRVGVPIKAAMKIINDKIAKRKEESLREAPRKDSEGALTAIGGTVKEIVEKLKPDY